MPRVDSHLQDFQGLSLKSVEQTEGTGRGLAQSSSRFSAGLLLAACVWRAAASGDPAPPAATAEPSNATLPILSGSQWLKQEDRIVVDTNAPAASTGTSHAQKALRLQASWRGWEGLHLELDQRTPLRNPTNIFGGFLASSNAPVLIQLDQVQMTARVGARLEVDGAGFLTTGNLAGFDDNVQLRRLLVSAQGDCILLMPVSYLVELGYIPNHFYVNQAYLLSPDINYIGNMQFGVFGPPMGLDLVTSSRDITFMEPAAPLQAIAPPNMVGLQIGHPVFNERATWALGIFGDVTPSTEYGNASKNYGSTIGRLTWLGLDHLDPDHPASNRFLHLGVSADYQYSVTSNVRYQCRPESYLAPIVLDTGNIDASGAATVAGEAAWVNGPFSIQGEFIHSFVQENNGSLLNFGGFYAQASCFLTGESRPYDPIAGDFKRLIPRRNFNFGKGGAWGAVELAGRFSHTDLDDAQVRGGRLNLLMAGVNWYLNPHVRWMFNYGFGHVTDGPSQGNMNIFQTRIGVDF